MPRTAADVVALGCHHLRKEDSTNAHDRPHETALDQDLKACRETDPIGALLKNLRQSRSALVAEPSDFSGALADRSGLLALYIACMHRGTTLPTSRSLLVM
jgi:hypothetical protein